MIPGTPLRVVLYVTLKENKALKCSAVARMKINKTKKFVFGMIHKFMLKYRQQNGLFINNSELYRKQEHIR